MGTNNALRFYWVKSMIDGKRDILAVQTLRNSIMTSSLLASTAILLASAVAAFASNMKLQSIDDFVIGIVSPKLTMAKLLILVLCFLTAFFFYLQAIRYLGHVSLLINVPPTEVGLITPSFINNIFARGANYHTLGTRCYYFAFPTMTWIFGPIPLALCTLLMLPVIYKMDNSVSKNEALQYGTLGIPGASSGI
jgi:uncharacterized membrane protein